MSSKDNISDSLKIAVEQAKSGQSMETGVHYQLRAQVRLLERQVGGLDTGILISVEVLAKHPTEGTYFYTLGIGTLGWEYLPLAN